MPSLRERLSDRLVRAGVELSIDRHEMTDRAEHARRPVHPLTDDGKTLLLTGWISDAQLWLARKLRPTKRVRSW